MPEIPEIPKECPFVSETRPVEVTLSAASRLSMSTFRRILKEHEPEVIGVGSWTLSEGAAQKLMC